MMYCISAREFERLLNVHSERDEQRLLGSRVALCSCRRSPRVWFQMHRGLADSFLFAISDFAWGFIYVVGLQRVTGRSQASLLLNRTGV